MKIRILYALCCVCGLYACSSIQTLTFDQLVPAQMSLPEQVKAVAVVNNMPSVPEPKANLLTFGVLNGEGKATSEALAGALADSRYFNQVIICDSALNSASVSGAGFRTIPFEEVKSLTAELGVDALISVDRVFVENEKKEIRYSDMELPWPYLQTKVTPVVHVYSPVRAKPIFSLSVTDSLMCDWDHVPSDKLLLKDVADIAAEMLCRRLVPYWEQTERLYFAGGCVEMRDAAVAVDEGDWEEACREWQELYARRKQGKMKGRAAFNMALGQEMQGNFEEAEQWLRKAGEYMPEGSADKKLWDFYAVKLRKRMDEHFRLKTQMGRFGNNLPQ